MGNLDGVGGGGYKQINQPHPEASVSPQGETEKERYHDLVTPIFSSKDTSPSQPLKISQVIKSLLHKNEALPTATASLLERTNTIAQHLGNLVVRAETETLTAVMVTEMNDDFAKFQHLQGELQGAKFEGVSDPEVKVLHDEVSNTLENVQQALQLTDQMLKERNEILKADKLQALRNEVLLLHSVLEPSFSQMPKETCFPEERSRWLGEVADQSLAIKEIEGRITMLMQDELVITALTTDDKTLDAYGNKHKNLVKETRVVRCLKPPGVEEPPKHHGVSSKQVQSFLKKHAPEIVN